jgi:hypothetical protein
MIFPIQAEDKREAATLGRWHPGVKHDHPDAVLWVETVTKEEYLHAKAELDKDIYWEGVRKNLGLFIDRLETEQRAFYETEPRRGAENFHYQKRKVLETEIRDYISREYRKAV